jgi:hypothetical protein
LLGPVLAVVGAVLAGLVPSPLVGPAVALGLVANPDSLTTPHDRTATVPAPGVLANDIIILSTRAVLDSGTSNGTVNLAANGGYTYVPDAGFVGTDEFWYHDTGLIPSNSARVRITVTNAAPTAANDSYNAVTGVTLVVSAPGVMANDDDADGDGLSASLVDGSGNGSLSLSASGGFTFKSGSSFTGIRTFTYRVSDGVAWSASATVSIHVRAPTPTPTPTPAPTPAPTPTPIVPLPTLPLPTLPVPSVSIPPLPIPTPTRSPAPGSTGTPGATPTTTPSASTTATANPASSPFPGASTNPTSTRGPGGNPSALVETSGSGGGATPSDDGRFTVGLGGLGLGPIDGIIDVETVGFDGLIEWAVPALVLSVPGLLLLLAVLAQVVGGLLWLPFARRWLGGFGFRRRRSRSGERRRG